MKKTIKKFSVKSLLLLAVIAIGAVSCNDDDSSNDGTARLSVRLTDAPGDYEEVLIDVQDVLIKSETSAGSDEESGWVSVGNVETGVYNLLDLTGGVTQLLASSDVPAGYLGQMRLVLGTENKVKLEGQEDYEPLSTPSAQQSGLKLQINQELEAGEQYSFILDFDVEKSIVVTGNGGYSLKPVIRVSAEAGASTISGKVHPTNIQSLITATNGAHTISAYTSAEGTFTLYGVPAGTYQITVTPDPDALLPEIVLDNVEVTANSTIDLETIFLTEVTSG